VNLPDNVRVVYRPKDGAERKRRADRANALLGTPWVNPPVPVHKVMFVLEGHSVRARDLGMVFNDACLMDAISEWGTDGPLYCDTLESETEKLAYAEALLLYRGVELPPQLRNPNVADGRPPALKAANETGGSPKPTSETN
jgi:hypothetical protein